MSLDRANNSGCAGVATGLQELRKCSELLQSRRRESRAAAMDNAAHTVLGCLDSRWPERQEGGQSPPPPLREPPAELKPLLLLLLRLSCSCPFDDIRERSAGILKMVQDRKVKIPRPIGLGPSSFIPAREILQDSLEETERQLFIEAFVSTGRLDNVTMVMGLHPQYLESFWKTQYYLLQMDGPLPYHYRHYIGLMNLLKTGESSWSLAELIHAVVLLSHYHSLASFVLGCGIRPEPDQDGGYTFRPPSPGSCHSDSPSSSSSEEAINYTVSREDLRELEALIERMKLLQEGRQSEEASQEEKATRFENEKRESSFVAPAADDNELLPLTNLSCFVEDADFGYKDFSRRGEQPPPTLRAQDYSWEDHGYSLINRLYPEVGQLLDEKFQVVYNLTYNTMAMHNGVDTSMLRRAIWNYIHCVFGIRYDDYDYGEVNQLLERSLKIYIKTVACYPEKTTKRMYVGFWRHFKHSEKVHINLLLLEARMQAALLYALRAITRYMT
ncbi:sestrin-2 isoform X3 [Mobula birostris]|uniref:sestrin-2 isoform X3 n=1 Tax=Mobula birostris TaxID=1983395 RepID=UPI003B28C76E